MGVHLWIGVPGQTFILHFVCKIVSVKLIEKSFSSEPLPNWHLCKIREWFDHGWNLKRFRKVCHFELELENLHYGLRCLVMCSTQFLFQKYHNCKVKKVSIGSSSMNWIQLLSESHCYPHQDLLWLITTNENLWLLMRSFSFIYLFILVRLVWSECGRFW